jgi:hypothetical protein
MKLVGFKVVTDPYLRPNRLTDLLAAIQTMALFDRYRRPAKRWAYLISGDESREDYWREIFDQHPEFFRPSSAHSGQYALVWRRAGNGRYHRSFGRILDQTEYDALSLDDKKRYISRPPVPEDQIKTLLDTAIHLHEKAVDARRERRWWVTPVIAVLSTLGSFAGAVIGARVPRDLFR